MDNTTKFSQVDLSNAFEDGKICLENMEERRTAGKVPEREEASTMEALKERFREEYRKARSLRAARVGRCFFFSLSLQKNKLIVDFCPQSLHIARQNGFCWASSSQ